MVNKTVFIATLSDEQQEEIESKLREEISDVMSGEEEIEDTVTHGMEGRLSDLEHTINIYDLAKTKVEI